LAKPLDEQNQKSITIYEEWAQRYPKSAVIEWQLGELYMYKDYDKVEQYARKALALDPKFARAYQTLSLIAEVRGDEKQRLEFLSKAAQSAAQDPSPLFYYASALGRSDPALHRKLSLEVATRFPESERGAQALYWLGLEADKQEERIAYLEPRRISTANRAMLSGRSSRNTFDADRWHWANVTGRTALTARTNMRACAARCSGWMRGSYRASCRSRKIHTVC
jgi:tetratricopeptide (TPR) repeat protein